MKSRLSFRASLTARFKRSTSCLNNPANAPMQYSAPGPSRTAVSTKVATARSTPFKGFKAPTMVSRPVGLATPVSRPASPAVKPSDGAPSSSKGPIDAASFYAKPKPAPKKIVIGEKSSKEREAWGGALHDPNAEGAVVMPRPSELDAKRKGTAITDVVIDPLLSSKMREHQKKGVEVRYPYVGNLTAVHVPLCHGHGGHQWPGVYPRRRDGSRQDPADNRADLHFVQWVLPPSTLTH